LGTTVLAEAVNARCFANVSIWIWRTAGVVDSSTGVREGTYGRSHALNVRMFSALITVVQSSCDGPSLAGGMSVVEERDAAGAGLSPVGDRHVEEQG
jgi:hypothetical protein